MIDVVLRTIRRYAMLPRGGRIAVAVSGGADSVALLHLLLELQEREELIVAGVAHFNHRLRGDDADADEEFCRGLAASLDLPFVAAREDVRARARRERRSVEDMARVARYAFLGDAVARLGADAVAVGHTLDDQSETFLLRLLRGAGTRGLGGIRPKTGVVVRPLLEVRRETLRSYAAERLLAHREDATNADVAIPRNRVRHELIPYLEREFSSGIVEVLAREAATAQEDEDRLHAEAIDLAASIVLTSTPVTIDADALGRLHPALAARVAREALAGLAAERYVGFDHIRRFLDFVRAASDGAALSLPGQQAVRTGSRVILRPEPPRSRSRTRVSNQATALSSSGDVRSAG